MFTACSKFGEVQEEKLSICRRACLPLVNVARLHTSLRLQQLRKYRHLPTLNSDVIDRWNSCLPRCASPSAVVGQKGGTSETDGINAAIWNSTDDSVLLVGYTEGLFNTTGLTQRDFAAVKLDVNGSVAWKWQVLHSVAYVDGCCLAGLHLNSLCLDPA